jgi:hypothetical protein
MTNNETLAMKWDIMPCEINNDRIVETGSSPTRQYNPFDFYGQIGTKQIEPLYRKFVAIDENNEAAILEFITEFGFLGLNKAVRGRFNDEINRYSDNIRKLTSNILSTSLQNLKIYTYKITKSMVDNNKPPAWVYTTDQEEATKALMADMYRVQGISGLDESDLRELMIDTQLEKYESIHEIKIEIMRMRYILRLWECMASNDINYIYEKTKALVYLARTETRKHKEQFYPFDIEEIPTTVVTALYYARAVMSAEINKQLKLVHPRISVTDIKEFYRNPEKSFGGLWIAPDLLAAMYTMIYMDFTQGKKVRKCKNETCSKWFEIYGNDERKIYCDPKCANTQGKRMSRRAKRKER